MSRRIAFALMVAVVLVVPSHVRGQFRTHPMSATERGRIAAADSTLDALRDWGDLHRGYPVLLPVDDGYISEGISDFVVQQLATHWESFPELATMAHVDTAFGSWVVLHIDATTDWNDLASIVRHASARGPRRFAELRRRILETARDANAEAHRAGTSPP